MLFILTLLIDTPPCSMSLRASLREEAFPEICKSRMIDNVLSEDISALGIFIIRIPSFDSLP